MVITFSLPLPTCNSQLPIANSDLRLTFPIGAHYVALAQTAQRTPVPADPLPLHVDSLLQKCGTAVAFSCRVTIHI